ncbi:conserved Plasmodium protein, unknown function [Plasmodium ovale curtisi]|uniref:Uncharacterized protein n=1 Tax=Plasmodium ovale curtisi TaxID=864141 RepID=A0A1A8VMS7_PLAOA|nr:conserved Plasmodium protein, unknown function [Plasmodium ovale curtisi]
MISIFSNYNEGNDFFIFEELNKGFNINDIFIHLNCKKRLESLEWSKEDINYLKLYFKQFKHMHNFLPFISEMLNKSSNIVKNQLIYLNYIDKRGNVIEQDAYLSSESESKSEAESDSDSESESASESESEAEAESAYEAEPSPSLGSTHSTSSIAKSFYFSNEKKCTEKRQKEKYSKRKKKQPLLHCIYKLKMLEQVEKDSSGLTKNELNCSVDTVLKEVNENLKSLYELKKLSKSKYFSYKALVFDIPLSISSDLLDHHYFTKLLFLLGFVNNNKGDEWILNENLDQDIFRNIVDKFDELHTLSVEQLKCRLYGASSRRAGEEQERGREEGSVSESISKSVSGTASGTVPGTASGTVPGTASGTVPGTVSGADADHEAEKELHLLTPERLKGTFKLVKLMYEFFVSNDDECRIIFNNLMNTIAEKCALLLESGNVGRRKLDQVGTSLNEDEGYYAGETTNSREEDQSNNLHFEQYKIYLDEKERHFVRKCFSRDVLEKLLSHLGVRIFKWETLILSKYIPNEKDFIMTRIQVINNYKTLAVQDIQSAIAKKEEEINEKKKKKMEKKPTQEQKFVFVKRVCEYLNCKYLNGKAHNACVTQESIIEMYFGDDQLLTFLYEKLNSWNYKRSKTNDEQSLSFHITDLLHCIIQTGREDGDTYNEGIILYLPLIKNICMSLKGFFEGAEEECIKWDSNDVQKDWLKIMLKLFYNILFDTTYNTVGRLFDEYKNIKEILNDHSLDFLDTPPDGEKTAEETQSRQEVEMSENVQGGNIERFVEEGLNKAKQKPPPEEKETNYDKNEFAKDEFSGGATRDDSTGAAYSKESPTRVTTGNIMCTGEVTDAENNPRIAVKRKIMDSSIQENYSHLFKKRKLQNSYINTYRKNRKIIIDSLLRNKNISQYNESDIVNKVKQVFIKARQMASNGDLRNRWKSREDVRKILLL